ncbi:MAG TPA: GNAT family protein [Bacillales bacterium]|nr:GNAT family protein [Bacillales bacterium]
MYTLDDVSLRPLTSEDMSKMYTWQYDIPSGVMGGHVRPRSFQSFLREKEERFCNPHEDFIMFGIEYRGTLVGYTMLGLIDTEHRHASVGIDIGEKTLRGKGIARQALRLLCDYGFRIENFDKICSEVYDFNSRSHFLMKACGFHEEGVLRKHEVHNGERVDMHVYGLLREDFYERFETIFQA